MTEGERDKEMYRETQVLLSAFATEEIGYETCIDAIKDMASRYAYAVALDCLPKEKPIWTPQGDDGLRNDYSEADGHNACRATFLANIKAKTNQ